MTTDKLVPALLSGSPVEPLRLMAQDDGPAVLAVITGVVGPSYRPIGAMLATFADGRMAGTLSSGCVEADIALRSAMALEGGPVNLRYGQGSPYFDIQLPCGGGLDILLVPNPNRDVIRASLARHDARKPVTLEFARDGSGIQLHRGTPPDDVTGFTTCIEPELFFCVIGKGPEASTFAALAHAAGYPSLLISPDQETLDYGARHGCPTHAIMTKALPQDVLLDDRSAVVLFFHDHDWEPPILEAALATEAFYIGAQGSQRTRSNRNAELLERSVSASDLERIAGPIGLIPSAKDARTLAVSVLAEVLERARTRQDPARDSGL